MRFTSHQPRNKGLHFKAKANGKSLTCLQMSPLKESVYHHPDICVTAAFIPSIEIQVTSTSVCRRLPMFSGSEVNYLQTWRRNIKPV
ncbi:hypothetical protein CesoFtcFv8_027588 [Champsocephalus esox]|uniref:Uncharacterized protein n=2 Tax=Champsocephalus TaxID=52236 RepID=A0AAN8BW03_CHAGU|nr:hypothetical protein CesoFtcFv8_027588 [Champsocephalus esox]KAK5891288.1 hypothetical protein CgunFtcFv8_018559 [Champsocephalus gunnari]